MKFAGLPLTLVPLFLVPVLMAGHFQLLRRRISVADSEVPHARTA
jgi:hypothetical protein